MTYSRHEAPVLIPIEYELMKKLGVDRSELHKKAIKEFYNRRQQSTLNLIWGRYGKDNQDQRCPPLNACRYRQTPEDETWGPDRRTDPRDVRKQEQEEMKGQLKFFKERHTFCLLVPKPGLLRVFSHRHIFEFFVDHTQEKIWPTSSSITCSCSWLSHSASTSTVSKKFPHSPSKTRVEMV